MKWNVGRRHVDEPSTFGIRKWSRVGVMLAMTLTMSWAMAPASLAHADEGEPQQCVPTSQKTETVHHDAVTHTESRWKQEIPEVAEVSHTEYRFFRDVPKVDAVTHTEYQFKRTNPGSDAVTHTEYQFKRTNPGHEETFFKEFKYKKVIPATDGVKECQYKKWVKDYVTEYKYAKYTQTKTRTSEVWANFSPDDKKGVYVGPPSWPTDSDGTWHIHGDIPSGHAGPDGVYKMGSGNGDWFYRHGAGSWSDFGPWTLWSPLSHVSWETFNQPSIGGVSFHGEGSNNGTDWYRQWQVRNTGETRQVEKGGHWEYQWATSDPGAGWTKFGDCRWKVEPAPEQVIFYKDGAWTTDTPGAPWIKIDERTVSNNDYVAPFIEYRKADGSASKDVAEAAWFAENAFDGWTVFNTKTVTDAPEIPGYREYKTTDGATLVLDEADWFTQATFSGWTVLDSREVVTQEFVPGYTIYDVEGGEPTRELGESNWTTKDPGAPWVFVDKRVVTDKAAYDTKVTKTTTNPDCTFEDDGDGPANNAPVWPLVGWVTLACAGVAGIFFIARRRKTRA